MYRNDTLTHWLRERQEMLLAEQTGYTKEQVHTLNNLEADCAQKDRGLLYAMYRDGNDNHWTVVIREDGSIDYTAGGAFPELAKHNR
jgi:hypothetical protein